MHIAGFICIMHLILVSVSVISIETIQDLSTTWKLCMKIIQLKNAVILMVYITLKYRAMGIQGNAKLSGKKSGTADECTMEWMIIL